MPSLQHAVQDLQTSAEYSETSVTDNDCCCQECVVTSTVVTQVSSAGLIMIFDS